MLGPTAADFLNEVDWAKPEEDEDSPNGGVEPSTGISCIVLEEGAPPDSITPAFASSAVGSCMLWRCLFLLLMRLAVGIEPVSCWKTIVRCQEEKPIWGGGDPQPHPQL